MTTQEIINFAIAEINFGTVRQKIIVLKSDIEIPAIITGISYKDGISSISFKNPSNLLDYTANAELIREIK